MLKLFTLSLLSLLLLLLLLALFTTLAPTDAAAMTKLMKVNPLIDPDGAQSGSASYDSGSRNSALGADLTSRISFFFFPYEEAAA